MIEPTRGLTFLSEFGRGPTDDHHSPVNAGYFERFTTLLTSVKSDLKRQIFASPMLCQ